ncbi:hypothetical protein M0R45_009850 [Rubus argutus]|uniref:Uncharacterized protein n=1 Tax=Rubus argutus TaxID=59490 RepID=A0AAW1Y7M6_RUBAR
MEPPVLFTISIPVLLALAIVDEESMVVPDEYILDLLLGLLIHILLVIRNQRLGDALTNCVDLRSVASSLDADPHVNTGEMVSSEK